MCVYACVCMHVCGVITMIPMSAVELTVFVFVFVHGLFSIRQLRVATWTEPKGRDFSGDLQEYLAGWEQKATVSWKFNKVLQAWALSNAFDENKIDADLFKQLCPYLESVQGESRSAEWGVKGLPSVSVVVGCMWQFRVCLPTPPPTVLCATVYELIYF